jgi:hypothetical protein
MKCLECEKHEIHCKGMCNACYTRWQRAGRPPVRFDYKTPVEKFRKDCQNGIVLGMLAGKTTHLNIARKYGISEETARKYMVHYKLITTNARSTKKKDRKVTFYTPAQMLALAMPWVKNSERTTYYG